VIIENNDEVNINNIDNIDNKGIINNNDIDLLSSSSNSSNSIGIAIEGEEELTDREYFIKNFRSN
jgi:hypothetical protein